MMRRLALAATCAAALAGAPAASAEVAAQPPLDISKLPYQPIGHFKPGDPIPADYSKLCDEIRPLMTGKLFNPSGTFNAFDTNVFETACLPFRNQDDESADDPWGNGGEETRHGYCKGADPADPTDPGVCPNHQLEFLDYYRATMMEVLEDFSPTYHEYTFEHPEGIGRNPAIVVAGADNPDEHILIGSHYDQTTTGPASTWDSQEGHAEMIRVAKLMADYWKATGTRPSATVKFVPMDGEEDGLLGSEDYVNNTIVPDQEHKVRGYWNADPCAGGYPARRYGNPGERIPLNIQIGDSEAERVVAFNEKVPGMVESVFDHIDDTIAAYPDQPEIYVSTAEGGPTGGDIGKHVFVSKEHAVLFSSDWANFIALDIPFFNPSPKVTGPSNGADPSLLTLQGNDAYGLYGFHTPFDNLQTMSRLTGQSPAGDQWPEGWMKGMEGCAHMLAWGMLQPHQGGAQTVDDRVVAYYEATPNEAERGKLVTFDAGGSHQYADPAARELVPDAGLQFKWDLGDGTRTYYGRVVRHAYRQPGTYTTKLTVTNRSTGATASMSIPVVVEDGTGSDVDPAGQDVDAVPAPNDVVACPTGSGFERVAARRAGRGLRFEWVARYDRPVTVSVYRAAKGRKALRPKRIARRTVSGASSVVIRKRLPKGEYFATVQTVQPNGQVDRRAFAIRSNGRRPAVSKRAYQRPDSCGLVSLFRLSTPVFGGRRALAIAYTTTKDATVTVEVLRGRKVVKRFTAPSTANRAGRFTLRARGLERGLYTVRLTATAGAERAVETLYARRL